MPKDKAKADRCSVCVENVSLFFFYTPILLFLIFQITTRVKIHI